MSLPTALYKVEVRVTDNHTVQVPVSRQRGRDGLTPAVAMFKEAKAYLDLFATGRPPSQQEVRNHNFALGTPLQQRNDKPLRHQLSGLCALLDTTTLFDDQWERDICRATEDVRTVLGRVDARELMLFKERQVRKTQQLLQDLKVRRMADERERRERRESREELEREVRSGADRQGRTSYGTRRGSAARMVRAFLEEQRTGQPQSSSESDDADN